MSVFVLATDTSFFGFFSLRGRGARLFAHSRAHGIASAEQGFSGSGLRSCARPARPAEDDISLVAGLVG